MPNTPSTLAGGRLGRIALPLVLSFALVTGCSSGKSRSTDQGNRTSQQESHEAASEQSHEVATNTSSEERPKLKGRKVIRTVSAAAGDDKGQAMGQSGMAANAGQGKRIAKGTVIKGKLLDALDSNKNADGDTFTMNIATGLFGDKTLKGCQLEGHVEGIKSAGMLGKKGELDVVFDNLITASGQSVPIEASLASAPKAKGKLLRNAAIIIGGAVAGHHLGKKTGKKHGALMGAAAATAVALTMPGGKVAIAKGTELKVRFDKPLEF